MVRFEDVEVGDEAPVKEVTLSRTDFVAYAGASGDFNPMHHDEPIATAAGMPSVFGHGMLSMGILATAVTDWTGAGGLRRMKVRFSRQTWPGETVATRIVAVAKREEAGRRLVDLECTLANAEGEQKILGEATVDLTPR
jgi:acyl dehydratase